MKVKALISIGYVALGFVGLCLCVYGLSLAWRPLGFIVGGVVLFVVGFGAWREQMQKGNGR